MKKFTELVFKFRTGIIISTILITLVLGYFIKDLKINADIMSSLPKTDPVVKLYNYIGEQYSGTSMAMIAIEAENIFNLKTIENINNLTSQFKLVEGVSSVTSLTDVLDITKSEDGGIEIRKLVDEYNLPQNSEELAQLKTYCLSKDMYCGRLVSEDATATLIACRLSENFDKIKTVRQLKKIVQDSQPEEKIYYGGLPFVMMEIYDMTLKDMGFLIPLVVFLICFILFFNFRTLRGIILPLFSVLISVIWTLGVMSILKIPLTVLSDIIPIILVAVGSAPIIHILSKYDEDYTRYGNTGENARTAFAEVGLRVILTSITIIFGFTSFIFGSYLTMIRQFGIFTALGVFFSLILSITLIPSVLSFVKVKEKNNRTENGKRNIGMNLLMDRLGSFVLRKEKLIIFSTIIICLGIGIYGLPKIERSSNLIDFFKSKSSVHLSEDLMQAKFGGSVPIQILVKGDIQDPAVLGEMKKIEDFLKSQGDVHNPQSVADLIEEMDDVMGEGKTIPDSKSKVSNLWFLLEGEDVMTQLVNDDKTEAVIQATMVNINSEGMRKLADDIDEYIKKINTSNCTFSQTGMHLIYQRINDNLLKSQVESFIYALILIFILLAFQLRSFTGGIIGLSPIILTVILIFGIMGIVKIPLDVATVLVASIILGIGIDYSIHFSVRFKTYFRGSATVLEALDKTLETTGRAILTNALAVAMGFVVLVFGGFALLQRFGVLITIAMVVSGLSAITFLPALILLTKAGFVGSFEKIRNRIKK